MFETIRFLDGLRGDAPELSPLQASLAASALEDRRVAAAEAKDAAEKQAARDVRLEAEAFAERQFGNPGAEMRRCQEAYGEAQDAVREAEAKLEKALQRAASYRSNLEFWASRAQQAADVVSRSVPERMDPREAAWQREQLARDDADRRGRAALERARAQVARRRGGRPSFRSAAAQPPAYLGDFDCCAYGTPGDGMPHDQHFPDAPYADAARSDAVLAEYSKRGDAISRKVSYR